MRLISAAAASLAAAACSCAMRAALLAAAISRCAAEWAVSFAVEGALGSLLTGGAAVAAVGFAADRGMSLNEPIKAI